MSCVFQNLAGLQNRYPQNLWQEILGNCDVQLFLGCTDPLTAEFVSSRTGLASVAVTSKAKQLGTWRISNYTPEYRETSGVGKRPVLTPDEVLRLPIDEGQEDPEGGQAGLLKASGLSPPAFLQGVRLCPGVAQAGDGGCRGGEGGKGCG